MKYCSTFCLFNMNKKSIYTTIALCFFATFILMYINKKLNQNKFPKEHSLIASPDVDSSENSHEKTNRFVYYADSLKRYAVKNNYATSICFLIDMDIPSGKKRFFVYDIHTERILLSGLVAHGSCNDFFLADARFSNTPDCGCSSIGKYKIGKPYMGKFGKAYKLYGLDESNSNAYKRVIVLHGYNYVPDEETYPIPICNSLGCPMVSHNFLKILSKKIDGSSKPILLWVFK